MRVETTLQRRLLSVRAKLDRRWWRAIWEAVNALIRGRCVQLTRLGRQSRRRTSQKHRIKAMDRLLGSQRVFDALVRFYRGLAQLFLANCTSVVVLVDWTHVRGNVNALVAAVPIGGRGVPILAHVYERSQIPTRRMHRAFLRELATVLPASCTPTLVTDAGFQGSWMQDVTARGWNYVMRLRHRTCVRPAAAGRWICNKELHREADERARDLGSWAIGKESPRYRNVARLILARRPPRHRHQTGRRGKRILGGASVRLRAAHQEPWLLATNLTVIAEEVVGVYATRMQVEEFFRDAKSSQFGLAFVHARSTRPHRLAVLLLIATLGFLAVLLAGLAGQRHGWHRKLQANTTTKRVFSHFQVGLLLLTTVVDDRISRADLAWALDALVILVSGT